MWLHIRGVGQWTNRLYDYFEKEQEKLHSGEVCANQKPISNSENNNQSPIKRIQATITRTFSNRDPTKKPMVQLVGYNNQNFQAENGAKTSVSEGDLTNAASCSNSGDFRCTVLIGFRKFVISESFGRPRKTTPEKRLHKLLFANKVPLEKSLSMPDIQTKAKKRERLMV